MNSLCRESCLKNQAGRFPQQAFSRIELLVVIIGLVILGCLLGSCGRSASKAFVCAANLRQVGLGFAMYAQQNGGKLPYAFIHYSDTKHVTWDHLVIPFVKAASSNNATGLPRESRASNSKLFLCPEDNAEPISWAKGKSRRTYSMSKHDMKPENWPPSSRNATGLGLWWASYNSTSYSKYATIETMRSYLDEFPSVKLNMISEPKSTILLTEFPRPKNIIGNSSGAVVTRSEMAITNGGADWSGHGKQFNYLMVDGHVEQKPVETAPIAPTNSSGIWTIRGGD